MEPPVWLRDFPRLVVVGDGNTGKSTVLNRFAEFDFSAVSDGVCTRRPIKLELRATSVENHERIKTLEGESVEITLLNGGVFVDRSRVVKADNVASNGYTLASATPVHL